MFMKRLKNNDSGIILVTVIMVTLVMSIVVIGIMSLNVSQVQTGKDIVESIKADQLATGVFYQYHQAQTEGTVITMSATEPIGNRNYSINMIDQGTLGGTTPNNTSSIAVTINY